jgi:hypothetical protein
MRIVFWFENGVKRQGLTSTTYLQAWKDESMKDLVHFDR